MAFIGNKTLLEILPESGIITPFYQNNIKNGAYELCLGEQVFQTDTKPRSIQNLTEGKDIYIAPGQFALLMTEEIVSIPQNKIAFISIKASIKFKGLVNVSGFHVDPGFNGRLLFSVYNAGPSTIVLKRGERCFPIWFADVDKEQDYKGKHEHQLTIPKEPVEALSQGDLASPSSLLEKIKEDYKDLNTKIATSDEAQKKRIELLEKEQKAIDYLVKIVLGLAIVLLSKFLLDWIVYNQGINKGLELKQKEIITDSIINKKLLEKKILLQEIDSIERKVNKKTEK